MNASIAAKAEHPIESEACSQQQRYGNQRPCKGTRQAELASLRSEEEAREAAQRLVTRFGPLFGGANMEVQRVDLGARGIYYREPFQIFQRDRDLTLLFQFGHSVRTIHTNATLRIGPVVVIGNGVRPMPLHVWLSVRETFAGP